jgi:hypothetical protein
VIRRILSKTWDTATALAAAVMAAFWLTPTVIGSITTELIAFFAIQSAVILPAMIFTAGLLRGDGLTVNEIRQFQTALRRQMYFWAVLLGLDVVAVATLIIGKASHWTWKITVLHWSADLAWTMLALATFTSALALLRMWPFVRGVMSLLELNGLLAVKTVQARELKEEKAIEETPVTPFEVPKGYGRVTSQRRKH